MILMDVSLTNGVLLPSHPNDRESVELVEVQ
jgi:hypothetical protein